jgi:uracil-DNA glycosylase
MIVGETAGQEMEPFDGSPGKRLTALLLAAGINRRQCLIDSTFRYRPIDNKVDNFFAKQSAGVAVSPEFGRYRDNLLLREEYAHEIIRLFELIRDANPKVIIAAGNAPLWALTGQIGIKKLQGIPIYSDKTPVPIFPILHPSYLLRAEADVTDEMVIKQLRGPFAKLAAEHGAPLDIDWSMMPDVEHGYMPQEVFDVDHRVSELTQKIKANFQR